MLEFKKREATASTLDDLGTLKEIAGKKGKISLIRKNFNDVNKRVAVIIENAKGESVVVSCSAQVSKALRDKKMTIAQLAGLNILENEEGIAFIAMPASGGVQTFEADKLVAKEVEVSTEFLPEELIAL